MAGMFASALTVALFLGGALDVNAADNYGITPLMVAANMGEVPIIQYLIEKGADLGAYDLGKKNDGSFGSSVEPLKLTWAPLTGVPIPSGT